MSHKVRSAPTWLIAALVGAVGLAAVTLATCWPRPGAPVWVLYGASASRADRLGIAVTAGGRIISQRADGAVLAVFDEPGFVWRLRRAGAVAALDAAGTAGCRGRVGFDRVFARPAKRDRSVNQTITSTTEG